MKRSRSYFLIVLAALTFSLPSFGGPSDEDLNIDSPNKKYGLIKAREEIELLKNWISRIKELNNLSTEPLNQMNEFESIEIILKEIEQSQNDLIPQLSKSQAKLLAQSIQSTVALNRDGLIYQLNLLANTLRDQQLVLGSHYQYKLGFALNEIEELKERLNSKKIEWIGVFSTLSSVILGTYLNTDLNAEIFNGAITGLFYGTFYYYLKQYVVSVKASKILSAVDFSRKERAFTDKHYKTLKFLNQKANELSLIATKLRAPLICTQLFKPTT